MQLTKLEIKGFKSFGDKATIHFNEGITGIVGPNGSGKSNIVDAIRWVLGEQKTRMLRSEKMENVIFNGTKKRKPTQLAEVSLTFDNTRNILPTEYSVLTVTRRYYRSGESEYELNEVPCRLKDITSLFLDTGISSNSYAIIESKMVDDLLTDKENSRRGLFEEAAGISKFKKRKKETLRKLDSADADLERVEDLLFEIEKNLKSLEKQARQAENYHKLKDQYKSLSISLALLNIKEQTTAYDRVNRQIMDENDHKAELTKKINAQQADIEKAKAEMLTREKVLAKSQKDLNDYVSSIRQYESDKKIKNERVRYLQDKKNSLIEQINQDKQSKDRAAFSIKSLKQELDLAQRHLEELRKVLEERKEEHKNQEQHLKGSRDELDTLTSLFSNKQNEVFQLKKALEINEIQATAIAQQIEKASSDSTEQSANMASFDQRIQELTRSLASEQKEKDKLDEKKSAMDDRASSIENTINSLKDELAEIERKLDARQNEFNLTKSLVDNLEGFPEAIKFLKKEARWQKKAPLLSDLITCDEKYRVPIENYLEPYLNYYVVNKELDAYKAINLLSDAAKGKAHFFILESFDHYSAPAGLLYENASPASEIIEFDKKYKNLVSYLLESVYLVEGNENSFPNDPDSIFISQSGKITKRRHSISGGSVGLFEGKKIGRSKNLQKLEKLIKKLDDQQTRIELSLKEQETLKAQLQKEDVSQLLEEKKDSIVSINQELIAVQSKQQQFNELISQAVTDTRELGKQLKELKDKTTKLAPSIKEAEATLFEVENKLNEHRSNFNEQNETYTISSNALNEENIRFHQQQNRIEQIEQELEFKQSAFESSEMRITANSNELKNCESEIKKLMKSDESSDDELIAMYAKKDSIEERVNKNEKEYYKSRGQIDETEKVQRSLQQQRESIDELLIEIHASLNDIKLELTSVKERLSAEFSINLDEVMNGPNYADHPYSEEDLREKVEKIRSRIERIGPINPMAKEAYDEIQERHEFILSQKQDLQKAKESLLTTIDEINLVAKATFIESFEKIKSNFIEVFRSLFTEHDDCDLRLVDPGNPLESAIEIMAKPKGKKPLTINQLSGGEKTLTATALLFSIYLLKPAPFCIFDEVDAPLDDANIDKFNQIIKQFSLDSQFIIVTHNKRTMEQTDVIYGITMVEQGVSKVVPVDLRALA